MIRRKLAFAVFVGTFTLMFSACKEDSTKPEDQIPPPVTALDTLVTDMFLPHEARPHGVPAGYDWSTRPRLSKGNDPGGCRAFLAWMQVYETADGNPAANTRVQIKDIEAWVLGKRDHTWTRIQSTPGVEGAAYVEDFLNNESRPADVRAESGGSISVTAGDGHNYHGWPTTGRAAIDPEDIGGIVTVFKARLILGDPNGPDDRATARYLANVGGDYYQTTDSGYYGDAGIGRFKYVRPEWRRYFMHTMSADELRQNPPPIDGM